jgi:glutamine synthetase
MSAFVGDRIKLIIDAIVQGKTLDSVEEEVMDPGARQLASLARDDTDRNRTSPFAFTGNRFEFRACGSNEAIGFPLTILNAAVAEVLDEAAELIESEVKGGASIEASVRKLTKKLLVSSYAVLFNGNNYSDEWVAEAERRGLPNLANTPAALSVFMNEQANEFLRTSGVMTAVELETRCNVATDIYCTKREIEFRTICSLVHQYVMPAVVSYKRELLDVIAGQRTAGIETGPEVELLANIQAYQSDMFATCKKLAQATDELPDDPQARADEIANTLMNQAESIAASCNELELMIADDLWRLPTQVDMLFLR